MTQENRSAVDGLSMNRADFKEGVQTIVTGRHVFDAGIGERESCGRLHIRSQEPAVDAQRSFLTAGLRANMGFNLTEKPLFRIGLVLDLSPLLRRSFGNQKQGTIIYEVPCGSPAGPRYGSRSVCRQSVARCDPPAASK